MFENTTRYGALGRFPLIEVLRSLVRNSGTAAIDPSRPWRDRYFVMFENCLPKQPLKAVCCRSRFSNQMPEDLNERKSAYAYIDTLQAPSDRSSKSTVLTHSFRGANTPQAVVARRQRGGMDWQDCRQRPPHSVYGPSLRM